jgi:transcriptional regulator with XRE-family HTH domain
MATNIGPTVKRYRERWRLTQQDLVDYMGIDRSASYISSIETGKTSPTVAELEHLARVFRTTAVDLILEAEGAPLSTGTQETPEEQRVMALFQSLPEADQALAMDLLQFVADRSRRGPRVEG